MTIDQLKAKTESEGLGAIITEHIDLDYPDKTKFRFNPEDYFRTYGDYRSHKLLLGVELGLGDENTEENRKIAGSNPFDYVIGSIHFVDGMDLYYEDFYRSTDKHKAYARYLEVMAKAVVEGDYFDCLGHIDYICRYARYDNRELYYKDFSDLLDQVMLAVINTGKVMELNTRRLGNERIAENLIKIYKRYYELGGRYATIGSDAHTKESVGYGFNEGIRMLEESRLKIVYFKERKMEYCI
jgi:histidinol-phosphatase (PHP family)